MLLIIYIASIATLLLGCSVWAGRKKEWGAQATFAGGAVLIILLLIPSLCGSRGRIESPVIFIVTGFVFVAILLACRSVIGAFEVKK